MINFGKQTLNQWLNFTANADVTEQILDYCEKYDLDPATFYLKEWEKGSKKGKSLWRFESPCETWKLEISLYTRPKGFFKATDLDHICMF